jgi:hypothetical protein
MKAHDGKDAAAIAAKVGRPPCAPDAAQHEAQRSGATLIRGLYELRL